MHFKKAVIFLFISIMLAFLSVGCRSKDITGQWERSSSDTFKGMRVEVSAVKDGYEAKITRLNSESEKLGYVVGDVKWKDIKKLKNMEYSLSDLGKDTGGIKWYEMRMVLEGDKKTLSLSDAASEKEEGSRQTWVRVEDSK